MWDHFSALPLQTFQKSFGPGDALNFHCQPLSPSLGRQERGLHELRWMALMETWSLYLAGSGTQGPAPSIPRLGASPWKLWGVPLWLSQLL